MFVPQRSLSRRTVLRGAGVAFALPLLDAMIPALMAQDRTPANPAKLRRLGFVYIPMGCDHSRWTPAPDEKLEQLTPILSPFEPVKNQISVLSHLELKNAWPGTHATSNASFLSAARARRTESNDYYLGTTVDQIAASQLGKDTPIPSLELSMDLIAAVGQCDNGYACVYQNCLSWSSPTTPLPPEANPRVVFEQLFGEGGSAADRKSALRRRASLLDSVNDEFTRLKKSLGPEDQQRIEEYQEAVRDVERRIQKAEQSAGDQLPDVERPVGVPASYRDHARLMFDLQKLALQGDMTRVVTFQMARETSNRTYPEIGVNEAHHPLTHHGNDPEMIAKMAEINRFHVSLFSEFLQVLGKTPEAGGTLLDNVLYLYGSGMGNPNLHDHTNLPIVVAGGAAGAFRGGRHVTFQNSTPLANLHLTLLDRVGIPMEQFADSTGRFDELFGPVSL
ncbi:MAG: DUF1552 domain-containing protein [Planctomycetaceae bacterium]|nr:DUF1552 domain-containing protein [Planctomycetaceae bacterium]